MSDDQVKNSGFSLTELLVSISIAMIILSVVVANQSTYTDNFSVTNAADEIALTIAQAQAYSVGAKGVDTTLLNYNTPYGVSFSLLAAPDGSNKSYIFFADKDNDGKYDGDWTCSTSNPTDECLLKTDSLRGNVFIKLVCLTTNNWSTCTAPKRTDITFVRPSTEARVLLFDDVGNPFTDPNMKGTTVVLESPKGVKRSVVVFQTGQISSQPYDPFH